MKNTVVAGDVRVVFQSRGEDFGSDLSIQQAQPKDKAPERRAWDRKGHAPVKGADGLVWVELTTGHLHPPSRYARRANWTADIYGAAQRELPLVFTGERYSEDGETCADLHREQAKEQIRRAAPEIVKAIMAKREAERLALIAKGEQDQRDEDAHQNRMAQIRNVTAELGVDLGQGSLGVTSKHVCVLSSELLGLLDELLGHRLAEQERDAERLAQRAEAPRPLRAELAALHEGDEWKRGG